MGRGERERKEGKKEREAKSKAKLKRGSLDYVNRIIIISLNSTTTVQFTSNTRHSTRAFATILFLDLTHNLLCASTFSIEIKQSENKKKVPSQEEKDHLG
jgi:hypothetical protein